MRQRLREVEIKREREEERKREREKERKRERIRMRGIESRTKQATMFYSRCPLRGLTGAGQTWQPCGG